VLPDIELAYLRARCEPHLREVFRLVMADLPERDRLILRFSLVDGLTLEQIAKMYAVNPSTISRWLSATRAAVRLNVERALAERLGLSAPALRRDLETILGRAGLPVRARIPRGAWAFVERDKKARAGKVRWILPRRIGRFSEVTDVDPRSLEHAARVVEGRVA